MEREYIWLGDMPIGAIDATVAPTKLYYVHVDHLDRPALMTDVSRTIVWKASYEPFGAVRQITGAAAMDLRFPGQWFQLENGLAYNWNRHYDATLGRYVQPDPLGFVDGPSLYAYAGQSPMMRVDLRGLLSLRSGSGKSFKLCSATLRVADQSGSKYGHHAAAQILIAILVVTQVLEGYFLIQSS